MKASIAPAPTEVRERIVKAAVTAVYDRYCSGSIAELESAVVALIGTPIPDDEEDENVLDLGRDMARDRDHLVRSGLSKEQGRAAERLVVLTDQTPSPLKRKEPTR